MSVRSITESALPNHGKGGGLIPARTLHFRLDARDEADFLVRKYHYSRRPPANVQLCGTFHTDGGLFGDFGPAIAACYFSSPPTRWSEQVLELSRLVRHDSHRLQLSALISLCIRQLKKIGADLLVSFADSTQGHEGFVYRASNWNYGGKRDRAIDGLVINGEFVPGRTCNARYDTRSAEKLAQQKPAWDIQPHYDEGKHLYWLALNKQGRDKAHRLGFKSIRWETL